MSEKKPRHNKPARESVPITLLVGVQNWVDVTVVIRHQWVHYPGDRVEHVDAPVHFISGAPGADEISIDPFIGPMRIIEAKEHDPTGRHIGNFPQVIKRRPQARQSSTDSKDRYRKRQSQVA